MTPAGNNWAEAESSARLHSVRHPDKYVVVFACFGLFLHASDRLDVHAPTDALNGVYWKRGACKRFTDAQIIADQNATPCLS
jgi:hypothetical protein